MAGLEAMYGQQAQLYDGNNPYQQMFEQNLSNMGFRDVSGGAFNGLTEQELVQLLSQARGAPNPLLRNDNNEADQSGIAGINPGGWQFGGNTYVPQFDAQGGVTGINGRGTRSFGEHARDTVEGAAPYLAALYGAGYAGGAFSGAGAASGGAAAGGGQLGGAVGGSVTSTGAAVGGAGAAGSAAVASPVTANAASRVGETALTAEQVAAGAGSTLGASNNSNNQKPSSQGGNPFVDAAGNANWGSILSAGAGAVAGYNGTGPNELRSSSTTSIDEATRGRLDSYADQARDRVGQSNPYTNQAAGMIQGIAGDQSGINGAIGANQGFVGNGGYNAMAGQNPFLADGGRNAYGGQNPYLNNMINSGVNDLARGYGRIGTGVDTTAARNNAFGSAAWNEQQADNQRAFGSAAGNYINNARFGDYQMQAGLDESRLGRQQGAYNTSAGLEESRLGRQQSAIGMAPGLDAARYNGANALAGIGAQQFGQQQQNWQNYGNSINQSLAGATTTNSTTGMNPNADNPWSSAIGGALLGSQIYNGWNQGNRGT